MTSFHFSAYIEIKHLTYGHSNTINSLSFSPGGTHLASGGDDRALCIWNVSKGQLMYRLLFDEALDCVLWHPVRPETVIVGLSSGFLVQVYGFSLLTNRRSDVHLGARSAVYCLDYDSSTSCLAIGMGEEVHVTREVSPNSYDGDVVFPGPPDPTSENPKRDRRLRAVAVKFHKNGTRLIASYVGHGIICWDTATRAQLWHMTVPEQTPNIGGAALSPSQRYIVVYNVANGLDLYNVGANGQQSPRKTYRFKERPRSSHHLKVQFIHGGKALLCGTTTGGVLVWETGSGEALQELSHGEDIIQAVDAATDDKNSYIATGSADKGQGTYIKIWRARRADDSIGNELPDAVGRFVVTARRLSSNELVARIANYMMGLVICAFAGWAGTKVPWKVVWEYCLLVTDHGLHTAQVVGDAIARGGRKLLDYLSTEGAAMAMRIVDVLRDACLAFLFPTGAPHPDAE